MMLILLLIMATSNKDNYLFEGKEIRSVWDSEKEDYFFSVVDVISALTDSKILIYTFLTFLSTCSIITFCSISTIFTNIAFII